MRRLVIVLLVLVGLLVAADFAAAAVAESAVSRQLREQIGLSDDPSVRINGFPFLAQALSGRYDSIEVDAQRIAYGQLRDLGVSAQLQDVTAPLSMLLGSGPKSLHVGELTGTVRISDRDLQRVLPGVDKVRIESLDAAALAGAPAESGDPALAELDPSRAARITGTAGVLGRSVEVSVLATLDLTDGHVSIVPRDLRIGGTAANLPGPVRRELQQRFAVSVDPGTLPLRITPTALRARDGMLEVSGTAADRTLDGATTAAR